MSNTTLSTDRSRDELRGFGEHYDYDVTYLMRLLDAAPGAFARFQAGMAMSSTGPALPADAAALAKLAALLGDDCGPCVQLGLRMAVEAGVSRELLETALDRPTELPDELRDAFEHARGVVAGENGSPERIARLRAAYGDEGLGELGVAIAGARIYPALKRALGMASSCVRASLDF